MGSKTTHLIKKPQGISKASESTALAGLNDVEYMTPATTKAVVDANQSALYETGLIAGEVLIANDSVFAETSPTFAESTLVQNIGDVTANTRVSIPVFGSGIVSNTLKLALRKFGTPSAALSVRLETLDVSGNPTGTLVHANATATVTASSLTTSLADTTISLAGVSTNNTHGITLSSSENIFDKKGVAITIDEQVFVITVTKHSSSTATTAYLYDTSGNIVSEGMFVGDIASFTGNTLLIGSTYYVFVDKQGASFTNTYGTITAPVVSTNITYEGGVEMPQSAQSRNLNSYGIGVLGTGFVFSVSFTAKRSFVLFGATVQNTGTTSGAPQRARLSINGTVLETVDLTPVTATWGRGYRVTVGDVITVAVARYDNSNSYTYYLNDYAVISSTYFVVNGGGYNNQRVNGLIYSDEVTGNASSNLSSIVQIGAAGVTLIPEGQQYAIVLKQVGDVVNNTNYYGIGYVARDSTTRRLYKYDGTAYQKYEYTASNNSHGITLSATEISTNAIGVRVRAKGNIQISSITKVSTCNATRLLLKTPSGNTTLLSVTFVGNVATLPALYNLGNNQEIRLELDNSGSSFSSKYAGTGGFPIGSTQIDYTNSSMNGVDKDVAIYNIEFISTRIQNQTYQAYINSTLVLPTVLSKTSAAYTYKLPTDHTRIVSETSNTGVATKTVFRGLYPYPGLTANTIYYASNTAGLISATPGTVGYIVGRTNANAELEMGNTNIISDPVITSLLSIVASGSAGTRYSSSRYFAKGGFSNIRLYGNQSNSFCLIQFSKDNTSRTTIYQEGVPSVIERVSITIPAQTYYRLGAYQSGGYQASTSELFYQTY